MIEVFYEDICINMKIIIDIWEGISSISEPFTLLLMNNKFFNE